VIESGRTGALKNVLRSVADPEWRVKCGPAAAELACYKE